MKFQKNAMSHLTTFLKILKCSAEKVCKISIKFCLSFKIRRKSVDIIRSNFVDQRVAVSRSDFRGAQMSGASWLGPMLENQFGLRQISALRTCTKRV